MRKKVHLPYEGAELGTGTGASGSIGAGTGFVTGLGPVMQPAIPVET